MGASLKGSGDVKQAAPVSNAHLKPDIIFVVQNRSADDKRPGTCLYYFSDTCLPNYRMGEQLGQGTVATVYRVVEKSTGLTYVAKFTPLMSVLGQIDLCFTQNKDDFTREVQIMRALSKFNLIVPIRDAYTCEFSWKTLKGDIPVEMGIVIMDMWDISLADYMTKSKPAYEANKKEIFDWVDGLITKLADVGYVNRDFRLDNIMLRLNNVGKINDIRFIDLTATPISKGVVTSQAIEDMRAVMAVQTGTNIDLI
jgi:serine/threonine protein kinase